VKKKETSKLHTTEQIMASRSWLVLFVVGTAVVSFFVLVGAIIVYLLSASGSSFLGDVGEHFHLDVTPGDKGYASPYLISQPEKLGDVCTVGLADAYCPSDMEWLMAKHDLTMAEMRYVHYVMLKANDTILHQGNDCVHDGYAETCTPSAVVGSVLHLEYVECLADQPECDCEDMFFCDNACARKEAYHCLDEVVRAHPLEYCRLVKNGPGGYREHKAALDDILRRVVKVAGIEARIEDVCDRWRGEEPDERTVREVLVSGDRFRIEDGVVEPPSFALWYTEEPHGAAAELHTEFQLFHIAHEAAHAAVPQMGRKLTEEACDARAAEWMLADADVEAAQHAIAAVAQQLCAIGQRERVDALGKEKAVRTLFGCE